MRTENLRPVVMPAEVIIFAGSEPAKNMPHFPTEEEAWEYIEELEVSEKAGDIYDICSIHGRWFIAGNPDRKKYNSGTDGRGTGC